MKRIALSFFGLSLVLITVSGCEKYLDVDPAYAQDAESYFNSEADYELALIGAYDLLQTSYMNIWIGEIASDNAIAGGESVTDTEGLHEIENMNHDAVNTELRNIWRWNYAGVARTNYIMEYRDKTDFEGKTQIIAETRFLRAFYYFQLTKYFGAVPLVVDRRLGAEEVTSIDRSPRSEVYQQIESDLNFAIDNLPWNNPVKGRVSKGAAMGLLGRVHLYQNDFDAAAEVLGDLIDENAYSLLPNYQNLWFVDFEGNQEVVFSAQFTGLEGGGYGCFVCLEGNPAPGFHGIRQFQGPIYGDGNSYNLPTEDLYQAFSPNDPRRNATILDIEAMADTVNIDYAIGGGGHTGYYQNKYIKRQGEIGLPDDDLTSPLNYKIIRYADVLLMAAEANAELGNEGIALDYLNRVRDRVGMPDINSSGMQLLEDIYEERRYELSGEGFRFFDLVRTGQAAQEIDGFISGKHELFPIPQVEIDLAGGRWDQNPSY